MPTISGNCVSFTLNACKQIRYLQDRHPTYRTRFMMQEKLQFDLYKIEQNKVQKKKETKADMTICNQRNKRDAINNPHTVLQKRNIKPLKSLLFCFTKNSITHNNH